jgi:hypothetical protein
MPGVPDREVACALCGCINHVRQPTGLNAFGSADLDTRPPPALRSTLPLGVQCCVSCGYCAADLGVRLPGADTMVADDDYRDLLDDPALPDKAAEFLCRARIEAAAGLLVEPFWATLSAAWVADDAQDEAAAETCRRLALAALRMARAVGRRLAEQPGVDTAIEVDLLRRAGEFAQADRCIRTALAGPLPDVIAQVLRFQRDLVAERDRGAHLLSEAVQ